MSRETSELAGTDIAIDVDIAAGGEIVSHCLLCIAHRSCSEGVLTDPSPGMSTYCREACRRRRRSVR